MKKSKSKDLDFLAPRAGLEPATSWLTVMRSTDWANEEYENVGLALSSRTASHRVFSAPHSLTSVFGMGTGGPCALWRPTKKVSTALSSRTASRRVFSAPHSLTSVFGMGTGGPYALWALTDFRCLLSFGFCLPLWQTSFFAALSFPSAFQLHQVKHFCFSHFLSFIFIRCESLVSYFSLSHYAIPNRQCLWCTFRDSNPGPTD